jgi:hypothetical protein
LFDSLEPAQEHGEPSVFCEPVSEFLAREPDGGATLQVRLAPSLADRPATLILEIGAESAGAASRTNLLGDDEALLKEKVVDVRLPPALVTVAGDVVRLPYRLTGQTIHRREIKQPGVWEVPFSGQAMEPLREQEILDAWPGADGTPVRHHRGFHGREAQVRKIEQLLNDAARPRSLMLIGQRRIGKTSLLWEMVRDLPPQRGRVCGAFLDAGGLNLKPGESMARVFFDFIVRYLLQENANRQLQDALRGGRGGRRALERPEWLAHKFDPDLSFKLALEGLADWLDRESNRRVPRLALFIDEFDKFVTPLRGHQRNEVDKLMWALREVVQRSERLALVLAGSGLLKLFVDGLDKPLHQSIFELQLEPFDANAPEDSQAISDTFLPQQVRGRLCPSGWDSLLRRAAALAGCHPYYLAMLGYASAVEARGQVLTAPLLNRVSERMIQGAVRTPRTAISSENFYSALFISLERLDDRMQAIAKALLATLARRTTLESPDLAKTRLIEVPHADAELAELTLPEERWEAYRMLLMEQAVEEDRKAQVHFRVPLSATPVRHDAIDIRHNALNVLRASRGNVA